MIDHKGLRALLLVGRSTAYEIAKEPDFPKPYEISSKTIRWSQEEVLAWLEAKRRPTQTLRKSYKVGSSKVMVVDGVTFRSSK